MHIHQYYSPLWLTPCRSMGLVCLGDFTRYGHSSRTSCKLETTRQRATHLAPFQFCLFKVLSHIMQVTFQCLYILFSETVNVIIKEVGILHRTKRSPQLHFPNTFVVEFVTSNGDLVNLNLSRNARLSSDVPVHTDEGHQSNNIKQVIYTKLIVQCIIELVYSSSLTFCKQQLSPLPVFFLSLYSLLCVIMYTRVMRKTVKHPKRKTVKIFQACNY